jgi:hypothetical protein
MEVLDARSCMHLTPVEQRVLDKLADGLSHERTELLACIAPNYKNLNSLAVQLWRLRTKMREIRQDIVTEVRRGGIFYRHIILLPSCKLSEDVI